MTVKWKDVEPRAMLRFDLAPGDVLRRVVHVEGDRCWLTYPDHDGVAIHHTPNREFVEQNYTLVDPFFEVGRLYGYHDRLFRVRDVVTAHHGARWAWGVFLNDDDEVVGTGVYTEASFVRFTLVEE